MQPTVRVIANALRLMPDVSQTEGMPEKKIELAPSIETEARRREVQLLINVVEPDAEYQPFILTDEASLLDAVLTEPREISIRLNAYFGADLGLDLGTSVWRLVDRIKQLRPGWPDEADPSSPYKPQTAG